ncbi:MULTISPECIES: hypothetical protein [Bartonella]|uniref:hypothetical protein n=1 Tax=Bartonella TaxID=773 RepID=UPI0018DBD572|nr:MULTISPECIES: hypothetical protein [Bartonella]MBH9976206.1 hypothetical protein [Bartonella choladocola]MBI0015930.1 hypothetical protein [Bartonella sp. B10834G3]MBI0141440.1 hypothetical protein [Bartonella choladocola]
MRELTGESPANIRALAGVSPADSYKFVFLTYKRHTEKHPHAVSTSALVMILEALFEMTFSDSGAQLWALEPDSGY